ncbi:MoaD/ThiS family protein [Thalassoglobus sp.]|uniref:MoaD/ThiS family protein n=1 Tax=Thalassoglobus sp. TaxID=2795869 RepID=UPI003AA8DE90
MQITVKLFARASQLAGRSEVVVEVSEEANVGEFRSALATQHPELLPIIDSLFVAINAEYANDDQLIPESAEVACFPPVSGG